jgi:hypothetical protein
MHASKNHKFLVTCLKRHASRNPHFQRRAAVTTTSLEIAGAHHQSPITNRATHTAALPSARFDSKEAPPCQIQWSALCLRPPHCSFDPPKPHPTLDLMANTNTTSPQVFSASPNYLELHLVLMASVSRLWPTGASRLMTRKCRLGIPVTRLVASRP